jgi:hypothetical protein
MSGQEFDNLKFERKATFFSFRDQGFEVSTLNIAQEMQTTINQSLTQAQAVELKDLDDRDCYHKYPFQFSHNIERFAFLL